MEKQDSKISGACMFQEFRIMHNYIDGFVAFAYDYTSSCS